MSPTVIPCETADQYLNELSLCNSRWWQSNQCHWIFRGTSSSFELVPSLYRKLDSSSSFLVYQDIFNKLSTTLINTVPDLLSAIENIVADQKYKLDDEHKKRLLEIIKAGFVEIALTEKFLLRCNSIRLPTTTVKLFFDQSLRADAVYDFYLKLTTKFIKNFIRDHDRHCEQNYELLSSFISFDYPEAMALARHHQIPSRLLDWTNDPLIAAFFSALNCKTNDKMAVWALNRRYLNQSPQQGQVSFYDKLTKIGLEYLHIQKGLFTNMLGVEEYFYKYGAWPTLDKYLSSTFSNNGVDFNRDYFVKIELDAKEINSLLGRLDRMDINKYSLIPTYDNVGQSVLFNYL